ncbi:hypothetical protein CEXT_573271 [Caerostris extrusa]|uniref:Uncharacterized protein n=1 Tax=Caerostris extrusa TaxID=172846 RepID=A0AAV4VPC7_CAEEX|nr:hypothetical protein CEXT_573271 [Caerostris extrusa]
MEVTACRFDMEADASLQPLWDRCGGHCLALQPLWSHCLSRCGGHCLALQQLWRSLPGASTAVEVTAWRFSRCGSLPDALTSKLLLVFSCLAL